MSSHQKGRRYAGPVVEFFENKCFSVWHLSYILNSWPLQEINETVISLKKQILTLFELLNKEDNKDSEEFEEAQQDLVHMFTCHAVLRSSFPYAVSSDLRWFNLLGPPKSL